MTKKISPANLGNAASDYRYNPDQFREFEESFSQDLKAFAGGYGIEINEHLRRTSEILNSFMTHCIVDQDVRRNIVAANKLHDVGKLLLPAEYYNLEGPPTETEIIVVRKQHIETAQQALEEKLAFFPHLKGHPHVDIIAAIALNHHEYIDGSGFQGIKDIDSVTQMIGIVDTYDGKLMPRPNKQQKTREEVLAEMAGKPNMAGMVKHPVGQFKPTLLQLFGEHFNKYGQNQRLSQENDTLTLAM